LVSVKDSKSEGWHETLEIYSAAHWLPRWSRLEEITAASVQTYISERLRSVGQKGRLSPVTLSKELSGLRSFLRWCKARGFINELPSWTAPEPVSEHKPVCLTREQITALLAQLPTKERHPKRYPAREYYTVMWATSFRAGTMARIRWEDVDLKAGTITVMASQDKRKFAREVPLTVEAIEALRSMLPGVGLVFGPCDLRDSLRSAAKRAKLPEEICKRISNHAIRHSRLTDFACRSNNVAAIQHMAGHRDLHSTMRYVHGGLDGARSLLESVDGHSGQDSGQKKKRRPRGSA
jgi:integrase